MSNIKTVNWCYLHSLLHFSTPWLTYGIIFHLYSQRNLTRGWFWHTIITLWLYWGALCHTNYEDEWFHCCPGIVHWHVQDSLLGIQSHHTSFTGLLIYSTRSFGLRILWYMDITPYFCCIGDIVPQYISFGGQLGNPWFCMWHLYTCAACFTAAITLDNIVFLIKVGCRWWAIFTKSLYFIHLKFKKKKI